MREWEKSSHWLVPLSTIFKRILAFFCLNGFGFGMQPFTNGGRLSNTSIPVWHSVCDELWPVLVTKLTHLGKEPRPREINKNNVSQALEKYPHISQQTATYGWRVRLRLYSIVCLVSPCIISLFWPFQHDLDYKPLNLCLQLLLYTFTWCSDFFRLCVASLSTLLTFYCIFSFTVFALVSVVIAKTCKHK